jgi:hypothetical protein
MPLRGRGYRWRCSQDRVVAHLVQPIAESGGSGNI